MTDLLLEELRPLSYARNHWIPKSANGRSVNPTTVWRWVNRGIRDSDGTRRIRLEVVCRGRTLFTSREAINRFLQAVTEARFPQHDDSDTAERSKSTTRRLQEAGLV